MMRRLSVVIPNYNYAGFVGAAIESALSLDWPDVEVIVVDDGSTDDSRSVIAEFGERITFIEQQNAGPRIACNAGYAASGGDVVIFLDSDDVLHRSLAREIAAVWRPGVTKVQVQMERIGADGASLGTVFPNFGRDPSPQRIRSWMSRTSAYPTPPGSGNAYSREFLERLFPLDDRCGDATDSACLAAAPFLGDVVTVPKPLVGYRIHSDNRSDLLADPKRFTRQVDRALQRHLFTIDLQGLALSASTMAPLFRSRHLLQMRVAESRLSSGAPVIPRDGRLRMSRDSILVIGAPGPESLWIRILGSVWCLTVLAAPRRVAEDLITNRYRRRTGRSRRKRVLVAA